MKKQIIVTGCLIFFALFTIPLFADEEITFEDDQLENAIRDVLEIPDDPIYVSDVEDIEELDLRERDIEFLGGMEHFSSLQDLNLRDNHVQDVTPLSSLTDLYRLNLRNNGIVELSDVNFESLKDMPHLKELSLRHNRGENEESDYRLSDLSMLEEFEQLEWISLRDNHISDISVFAHLPELRNLNLRENFIEDLSPLAELENLRERLYLKLNPLVKSDFDPIKHYVNEIEEKDFHIHMHPDPYDLAQGPYFFTYWSPDEPELSFPDNMVFQQSDQRDPSLYAEIVEPYYLEPEDYHSDDEDKIGYPYDLTRRTRITALEEDGVGFINTGWDRDLGAAVLALDTRDAENVDIYFTAGTVIPNYRIYAWRLQYRVGKVGDEGHEYALPFKDVLIDGEPVEYVRFQEGGHEERFGPVSLPEDALDEEYVQLRWKYYHVSYTDGPRAKLRLDNISVVADDEPVHFVDDGLENAVLDALGQEEGPVRRSRLLTLTELDADSYHIESLHGIEQLSSLRSLDLSQNDIEELTPLAQLQELEYLSLADNNITDVHPLASLTSLQELYLNGNTISDISSLQDLTDLEVLSLAENSVSDIEVLSYFTELRCLHLQENNISDISPLQELEKLRQCLFLSLNPVEDFSPIAAWYDEIEEVDFLIDAPEEGKVVEIPDDDLRAAVREVLFKPEGDIYQGELEALTALDLRNRNVRNLEGLQYALNLQELSLYNNQLDDTTLDNMNLEQLSDLPRLKYLSLENNELTDLAPLHILSQLEGLSLKGNQVEDLTPLWYLVNLQDIDLRNNNLRDVSPLRFMPSLEGEGSRLYLQGNEELWNFTSLLPRYFYIETVDFKILDPVPHTLKEGDYEFNYWSPYASAGEYPENMLFLQSDRTDPLLEDEFSMPYYVYEDQYHADDQDKIGYPYNLTGRTRVNGLYGDGVAFINTGRGRDLGAAVLALDTSGMENIEVTWEGGTLTPNSRVYNIRLQYRVGFDGEFQDVPDENNEPVEYEGSRDAGDSRVVGPFRLPEEVDKQPYVQIRWKYYYTGERLTEEHGRRDQLRLDDIVVTGDRYTRAEGWQLYQ